MVPAWTARRGTYCIRYYIDDAHHDVTVAAPLRVANGTAWAS